MNTQPASHQTNTRTHTFMRSASRVLACKQNQPAADHTHTHTHTRARATPHPQTHPSARTHPHTHQHAKEVAEIAQSPVGVLRSVVIQLCECGCVWVCVCGYECMCTCMSMSMCMCVRVRKCVCVAARGPTHGQATKAGSDKERGRERGRGPLDVWFIRS